VEQNEKLELVELVKGKMTEIAKAEAEGAIKKAEELQKGLEDGLKKFAAENYVSKADFDKQEGEFKKQLSAFEAREQKEMTFQLSLAKALKGAEADLVKMADKQSGKVSIDVRKDPGTFTAAASMGGNSAANNFAINNNQLIVPIARRIAHVRDVLGMGSTSEAVWPFWRETPKEGAFGTQNPEGAKKPQIEYKGAIQFANAETIAAFQKIGRQTLRNVNGLATFFNTVMVQDLLIREDNQLLFGTGVNGQVEGIFTNADDASDLVAYNGGTADVQIVDASLALLATLASKDYIPGFLMMSMLDYYQMIGLKDKESNYLQQVVFDSATGNLFIAGVPVIPTTAIAAGNLGAGDGRFVMPMSLEGISLRFFEEDEDNVQRNVITARIEEEVLNPVLRTDAFIYDTVANIVTAITTT
jgi:hypothetical protein